MSIKLKMSTAQFIQYFGQNEYVRFFSDEGVGVILDRASDNMNDDEDSDGSMALLNLLEMFSTTWEFDADEVYDHHSDQLLDNASDILAIARKLPFSQEIKKRLVKKKGVTDIDLIKLLEPDLSMSDDFVKEVASLYAKKYDVLELRNGFFMKFP